MSNNNSNLPSFDTLKSLAIDSPEELEALRLKLTRELIESAKTIESKRRLEGLNFKIEMNRKISKNSLQSCLKISKMMWDHALDMTEAIKERT